MVFDCLIRTETKNQYICSSPIPTLEFGNCSLEFSRHRRDFGADWT